MGRTLYDNLTDRQARMVLNAWPEIGPITRQRLLAKFEGDARAVLRAIGRKPPPGGIDLHEEEVRLKQFQADFIVPDDPAYPKLLRETPDAPVGLYRRGAYAMEHTSIAVVGTRRATLYGQEVARRLGRDLCALGFCVVSGLARGIDTAAHEGALAGDGRTVAVLGTGLDLVYPPENKNLFRRIEESGAVLSEFPFGWGGTHQSFPMRNRIVSGMCIAVVVVESAADGGAMITARLAGEQGRTLFAVPGRIDQPTSVGCHQLIRDGASLLTRVDDILSELQYLKGSLTPAAPGSQAPRPTHPVLTPDEKQVLRCFRGGAILSADDLTVQTGLPAGPLSALLLALELKRAIQKQLDGRYEASGARASG